MFSDIENNVKKYTNNYKMIDATNIEIDSDVKFK